MYFVLLVWIYGVTIAVIPVQFPSSASCEAAGQAFLLQLKPPESLKSPGYVCVPINPWEEDSP